MATTRKLLIIGFIKEFQKANDDTLRIPNPVIQLIIIYYPILYKIYGIGPNNDAYAQPGVLMSNLFKSFRYSEYKALSNACDNMYQIRFFIQDIIIMNTTHQIYRKQSRASSQYDRDNEEADNLSLMCTPSHDDYISVVSHGICSRHKLLVSNNGKFYGLGENDKGQLGIGNAINMGLLKQGRTIQPLPIYDTYKILKGVTIINISCGLKHSVFLTSNGKVMSCGYNKHRQCGISLMKCTDSENRWQLQPTYVTNLGPDDDVKIIDIQSGLRHNLCLSMDGKLYVFGGNDMGQLGMGIEVHRIEYGLLHPFFAENGGLVKICCGKNHSVLLDDCGKCYLFGHNSYGQMGTDKWDDSFECVRDPKVFQEIKGYEEYKICNVACGGDHSLLMRVMNDDEKENEGKKEIIAFGHNNYGQVNRKTRDECITAPSVVTRGDIKCEIDEDIVGFVGGWDTTLVICKCRDTMK